MNRLASIPSRRDRVVTTAAGVLVVLTALAWLLGDRLERDDGGAVETLGVALLLLGLAKSAVIIRFFMEAHESAGWVKVLAVAWLVSTGLTVVAFYLSGS